MAGSLLLGGVLLVLLVGVVAFLAVEAAHIGRELVSESPLLSRMFMQQPRAGERVDITQRSRPADTLPEPDPEAEGALQRRSRDTIRRMIDYFEDTPE